MSHGLILTSESASRDGHLWRWGSTRSKYVVDASAATGTAAPVHRHEPELEHQVYRLDAQASYWAF
jgi:hypothetical protein